MHEENPRRRSAHGVVFDDMAQTGGTLATEKNQRALKAFEVRRVNNKGREKVNNAILHTGSFMYYYCEACDAEMRLPETHSCPVPRHCDECKKLKEEGLLE